MNKIINALLQAKFPTLNVEALLEVINATASPEVATELLCGLYEEPKINNSAPDTDNEVNRVFHSYNKFTKEVQYSYNRRGTKKVILRKDRTELPNFEDKSLITCYYIEDIASKLSITKEEATAYELVKLFAEPETTLSMSETSLNNWNK